MKELLLVLHPTFGVLGVLAALWVFVDALNVAAAPPPRRIHYAAQAVAGFVWLSFLVGGYMYVTYYGGDQKLIQAGAWPWAHGFFMQAKAHLFFTLLLLSTYLPIVTARTRLAVDGGGRQLVMVTAALVVLLGLAMGSAGALVSLGVRMGLGGVVTL